MKRFIPVAVMFLVLPLYAGWNDHGLTLVSSGPSSIEGATKFELKDKEDRTFNVNSVKEPENKVLKRILKQKDSFFAWKHVTIKDLSFYVYEKGIQISLSPSTLMYKDTDLKPYLPSGFNFVEEYDGLTYRYRIIVANSSLKLNGAYSGEEPLLEELYAYVKGIREGRIIVEDEKVISGSVVSFSSDVKKESKQIFSVVDIPDISKEIEKKESKADASENEDSVKLNFYVSAQGTYLLPVSIFSDIFIGGYGFTLAGGLRDIGISIQNKTLFKLEFELSSGFWHLDKRKQNDLDINCAVKNAYTIPIILTARTRFEIMKNLSIAPGLGFGYNYNRLNYNKLSTTGYPYSLSVRSWNPSLMVGLRLDYRFDKFFIFGGGDFLAIFERRMTITTILFNAGGGYLF